MIGHMQEADKDIADGLFVSWITPGVLRRCVLEHAGQLVDKVFEVRMEQKEAAMLFDDLMPRAVIALGMLSSSNAA